MIVWGNSKPGESPADGSLPVIPVTNKAFGFMGLISLGILGCLEVTFPNLLGIGRGPSVGFPLLSVGAGECRL